jgi:hypothetical protein
MAGIYRLKPPGRKKPRAGSEEGNPDDHYDHRTGNDHRHDPAQRASRRGRLVRDMAAGPGVTRSQATTAMVLAETVAAGIGHHTDKRWPNIQAWRTSLACPAPPPWTRSATTGLTLPTGAPTHKVGLSGNPDSYSPEAAACEVLPGHRPGGQLDHPVMPCSRVAAVARA